ncbi:MULTISPECIES: hypothetical protein [unclassified Sphingomonas]|jgi:hypothetical protein|uniref:hypothetical protein n=1 Tax=unclassified Sphingomonas TaxID=196159 RepID=UPI000E103B4B|nr:hypothetical protein [Sphingomonas sp. FARSPH]AXJ96343.1 hypothetical protein DM480_13425 [Sphingomonas sp. FARSPH]
MIDGRIRAAVIGIVEMKRNRQTVDWDKIEADALSTIGYIHEHGVEVDNRIYHFLEDADARRKSSSYAQYQIDEVLSLMS